jgi:XTP/dITP diphosphohydrolase
VRLMLATGNRHKLREFQNILAPHEVLAMPAWVELPPEGEDSFVDNARGKAVGLARAVAAQAGKAGQVDFFMADDSGLEVEALGWAPGVTSARYAGEGASDEDNYVKLLSKLEGKGSHERRARFVCVVVAVSAEGRELVARGEWWGTITFSPHGGGGFGYDPVFLPEGSDLTVAQIPQACKDQASHRALAGSALLESFEREGLHAPGSDPAR